MERNHEESGVERTYRDEAEAAEAIKKLRASGIPADARQEARPGAPIHPLEQARDIDTLGVGPAPVVPVMSRSQYVGSLVGALIGTLSIGGVAAILGAVLLATDQIGGTTFVAIIVGGVVAGSVAGGVLGGSQGGQTQIEREARSEATRVTAHPRTQEQQRRARTSMDRRRTG